MSANWKDCLVGDIVNLKRGYDLPKSKRQYGSIPIVSSAGICDYHNQTKVKGPGVVTGRYGTIGNVYFIKEDFFPLNTTLYVQDFKGNDERFISYFLLTIDFWSCSDKAAVPGVNRNHLHLLKAKLPPIQEQKKIAQILSTLDEKIEINKKTNQNLEAIAKTLFKSWFIDCDPVKARVEGLSTGLPPEFNGLFPNSFENDEAGEKPVGWGIKKITDICLKINDKPDNKEEWQEEKLIDLRRMPSNSLSLDSCGKGVELDTSICNFQKYDFLFGSIRPYFYKAGIAPFKGVSNTSVFILRSKSIYLREFLYCVASSKLIFEKAVRYSKGTKMPIISWKDFAEFTFLFPNNEIIEIFSKITSPIFEKILNNIDENYSLVELRDTLLRKLISGELRISDTSKILEQVGI